MPAFSKGQSVKVKAVLPQGPVLAFRMDSDGVVYCLVEWVDSNGQSQQRWFPESDLVAA